MIDPDVTDLRAASRSDQEWWLLFCIAVAGKNSDQTAEALGRFKFYIDSPKFPLMHINDVLHDDPHIFEWAITHARFGLQTKIKRAFAEASRQFWCRDFKDVDVQELEGIYGIGPKTARFFKMTTTDERHAALDTHILKWLRKLGYENVPKSTPQGRSYRRLEEAFIHEADRRGMTVNELDLAVWLAYKHGCEYEG